MIDNIPNFGFTPLTRSLAGLRVESGPRRRTREGLKGHGGIAVLRSDLLVVQGGRCCDTRRPLQPSHVRRRTLAPDPPRFLSVLFVARVHLFVLLPRSHSTRRWGRRRSARRRRGGGRVERRQVGDRRRRAERNWRGGQKVRVLLFTLSLVGESTFSRSEVAETACRCGGDRSGVELIHDQLV